MKTLTLLVGPQGSGKTHFYNRNFAKTHTRISQDDQGKNHMNLFLQAIKEEKENIVVDRMNFSKEQRERFIKPAREAGYQISIIGFNGKLSDCFKRLLNRKNHPTLPAELGETRLLQALEFYQTNFEPVQPEEYDFRTEVNFDGTHAHFTQNPYIYDIGLTKEALVIGDVHGCYDELVDLVNKYRSYSLEGKLIFCGDLVDKGDRILKTVYFAKENGLSVMGNHENKLQRYLKGNKVNVDHGLNKTLDELSKIAEADVLDIRLWLLDLPLIIKMGNAVVVHAGINPEKSIYKQKRENLLYTRNWNPHTKSFNTDGDKPWYEYYEGKETIYFGHEVKKDWNVKHNVRAMDAGCSYGEKLRGIMLKKNGNKMVESNVLETGAYRVYYQSSKNSLDNGDILAPYEKRVEMGLIRKVEDGDLVLYNYTDKCTFEKAWDEYTIRSRGIVFDKNTKEIVARPFSKFFNINETEETQIHNLPAGKFFVAEKMDGSLGIIYNYKGKWRVNTRGSFNSEQAIKGQELFDLHIKQDMLDPEYTYLAEIIYPENKIIVDYKDTEALCLLGAIHNKTGKETYPNIGDVGFTYPIFFSTYDLDFLMQKKKTMDKNNEGWVIKFPSTGMRVKIKGDKYLAIAKVLSRATPLAFWENMKNGIVDKELLAQIPEEIYPQVEPMVLKLEAHYVRLFTEIHAEYLKIYDENLTRKDMAQKIGQYNYEHKSIFFSILDNKHDRVEDYIKKQIKPSGNVL